MKLVGIAIRLALDAQLQRAVHEVADAAAPVAVRQRFATEVELDAIAPHEIGARIELDVVREHRPARYLRVVLHQLVAQDGGAGRPADGRARARTMPPGIDGEGSAVHGERALQEIRRRT
jgi:hypothetical protein